MTRKQEPATIDPTTINSVERWPAVLAYRGFDLAALISSQQRTAEALAAAVQKLLEGIQDISMRQVMLQSALFQQMIGDAITLVQNETSDTSTGRSMVPNASAVEKTLESMHDILAAACKCNMDAFAAFQGRMLGESGVKAPACEKPAAPRAAA
jgi:hypothetical protein